jgi:hypothetical protein
VVKSHDEALQPVSITPELELQSTCDEVAPFAVDQAEAHRLAAHLHAAHLVGQGFVVTHWMHALYGTSSGTNAGSSAHC